MPRQATSRSPFIVLPAPNKGNGTALGQVSCVVGAGAGTGGAMLTSGTYTAGVDASATSTAGRLAISVGTAPSGATAQCTVTLHGGRTALPKGIACNFCAEANRAPQGIISVRNMALSGNDVTFDLFFSAPINAVASVFFAVFD
jgi:hypothetical protein